VLKLGVFVFEDFVLHLLLHALARNRCIIRNKEHLLPNRFKPLDVSEGLSDMEFLTMPNDSVAIEKEVIILLCKGAYSGFVYLKCGFH